MPRLTLSPQISLSFSGIEAMESGQQGIEGFLKPTSHGPPPSPTSGPGVKRKRESSPSALKHANDHSVTKPDTGPAQAPSEDTRSSFSCKRCGVRVALADGFGDAEDAVKEEALATLRLEHDDFHFAQDLAEHVTDEPRQSIRPQAVSRNGTKKPSAKKKRPDQAQGIARFFNRS